MEIIKTLPPTESTPAVDKSAEELKKAMEAIPEKFRKATLPESLAAMKEDHNHVAAETGNIKRRIKEMEEMQEEMLARQAQEPVKDEVKKVDDYFASQLANTPDPVAQAKMIQDRIDTIADQKFKAREDEAKKSEDKRRFDEYRQQLLREKRELIATMGDEFDKYSNAAGELIQSGEVRSLKRAVALLKMEESEKNQTKQTEEINDGITRTDSKIKSQTLTGAQAVERIPEIDVRDFDKLSSAEQEKLLEKLGVHKNTSGKFVKV